MYLRLIRSQGSIDRERQEAATKTYVDRFIPAVKQAPGYAGYFLGVNRPSGAAISVTYWQDERSALASAPSAELRAEAERALDCVIEDVDILELVFMERLKAPAAGMFMRSNDVVGDASQLEPFLAGVRDRIYPLLRSQPGFRSLAVGINRASGRTILASTWDTMDDLERSEAAIVDIREKEAAERSSQVKVEQWEVPVIEILAPTVSRS